MLDVIQIFLLALFLEMVDNGLGGGFGTLMSPLLVLLGYEPKVVVSAILFSEMVSGIWGGFWHMRFGNVHKTAVGLTLAGSLVGMASASFIIGYVLPSNIAKLYISVIALLMGVFVTVRSFSFLSRKAEKENVRSWKTVLLGFLTGFNKGGTGGGYGPLSVSGYMLLGLPAALAVGTTTVAEGISCALGFTIYFPSGIDLILTGAITLGSFIADPISAWVNNYLKIKLKPPFHGRFIGIVMVILGAITLWRTLVF